MLVLTLLNKYNAGTAMIPATKMYGMLDVLETSHIFRARARRPPSNGESWTSGPAPWLPRVESLELRSSQRKAPSVQREQPSLRGDVGALDLGPSQNEPLISRRSRCNSGDAFGVRTRLFAIPRSPHGGRGGLISRRRRGRAEEGKAGDRLRPTPPGSSATRSGPRPRGPDPSQGSSRSLQTARERKTRRHGRRDSIVVRRARRSTSSL